MITTAKRLESVNEYYFSHKLREIDALNRQGKNIINLGIGSPDMPPHTDVIRTLQEESAKPNVHGYQNYKGSPVLRNAFAGWYKQWYDVDLDADTEILPLIGSKEGIMHLCMAYVNEGDKVLVPNPGYPTYRSAVQLAGGECVDYKLTENQRWFPDRLMIEVSTDISKVKMMFLNYPHMPSGQLPEKHIFEMLIDFAKRNNILLVHDNPYSFILNDDPMSILSIPGAKDVAVELNSLSKSHNMAGWRVGVLCGAKERIDEVLRFKSNMDSGMFLPVQLAAVKALSLNKQWYDGVNAVYKRRRERVYALLDALGCTYSKQQSGLFVWAKIPDDYENAYSLSDKVLYEHNVFITPGGIFGSCGKKYIRVSLCATEEKIEEATGRVAARNL